MSLAGTARYSAFKDRMKPSEPVTGSIGREVPGCDKAPDKTGVRNLEEHRGEVKANSVPRKLILEKQSGNPLGTSGFALWHNGVSPPLEGGIRAPTAAWGR